MSANLYVCACVHSDARRLRTGRRACAPCSVGARVAAVRAVGAHVRHYLHTHIYSLLQQAIKHATGYNKCSGVCARVAAVRAVGVHVRHDSHRRRRPQRRGARAVASQRSDSSRGRRAHAGRDNGSGTGNKGPDNGNKGTDNGNKGTDKGNKGTDNGNKGTDNGNKGTDNGNKGTDNGSK